MLPEELVTLVRNIQKNRAESSNLEVKTAHEDCPRLYDTLSSFSNQTGGGTIVFGLSEKESFAVVGVRDVQALQKSVTEQCTDQMQPPVRMVFTIAETEGKAVCAAEIPGLDVADRPCYYKGKGRAKGSYIRVGDGDFVMTDLELYSFDAFRRHVHDDVRPIERASMELLDTDAVTAYILQRKQARPGFAKLTEEQIRDLLGLTSGNVPTLAAVLNFGIYPQGLLPQLAITAIVVPGMEIGETRNAARFLDIRRIEGTLNNMLEEAMAFCARNMKRRTIINARTGRREDVTEYPLTAIREAVLNALIHRDYSQYTEGTPIQIVFFDDRLEIHSPGCLYGRLTVDQLGTARPDLRNPTLAVMAEALTAAENRYSGIPTIRREMAACNLPAPIFENRRDEFVVTLKNQAESRTRETERPDESAAPNILEFCATPRTREEIANYLGIQVSHYMMKKYVAPLLESGALRMTHPEKPRSKNQSYVRQAGEDSE